MFINFNDPSNKIVIERNNTLHTHELDADGNHLLIIMLRRCQAVDWVVYCLYMIIIVLGPTSLLVFSSS